HVEPVRPARINPRVPIDLESICLKAMAKRPEDRYVGCRALADDLRRWLDDEPVQARPLGLMERGRRWLKREPVLASATIVAAVALLAAVLVPLGSALQLDAAIRSQDRARKLWEDAVERANLARREAS